MEGGFTINQQGKCKKMIWARLRLLLCFKLFLLPLFSFLWLYPLADISAAPLTVSCWIHPANYSGGSGTSADPYIINGFEDLICLSQRGDDWRGNHFIQTADIDFGEDETTVDWNGNGIIDAGDAGGFLSIGRYPYPPFSGLYDGGNHTISNIYRCELFAALDTDGVLRNLGLLNIDIFIASTPYGGALVGYNEGEVNNCYTQGGVVGNSGGLVGTNIGSVNDSWSFVEVSGSYNIGGLIGVNKGSVSNSNAQGNVAGVFCVGGLAGINNGIISGSYATGSIEGSDTSVGGLVGSNTGAISNSSATGNVNGTSEVGGFVGLNGHAGTIINCFADGDTIGSGDNVGGLVGQSVGAISYSSATGKVEGDSDKVGGLVGTNINMGEIDSSHAAGAVVGYNVVGGLVGWNSGPVNNSYATGKIDGTGNQVGGLVGDNDWEITNSYATGNVTGSGSFIGGLIGSNNYDISGCYATGNVTGSGDAIGGLVGSSQYEISGSHATGNVVGSGNQVGGLIGTILGTVNNSYATGYVKGLSDSVGGLIGDVRGGEVSVCYAEGAVVGVNYVGGMAGKNDGSIINSYAKGGVVGTSYLGGLVGGNFEDISKSYATGKVTGYGNNIGGLAGYHYADWFSGGTIINSYWDIHSGSPDNGIGTGLTTTQFYSTDSNFGLNFTVPWNIIANPNQEYPWVAYAEGSPYFYWGPPKETETPNNKISIAPLMMLLL